MHSACGVPVWEGLVGRCGDPCNLLLVGHLYIWSRFWVALSVGQVARNTIRSDSDYYLFG
jgi:hypothetical protein